jgi:hypothetical protein
MQCKTWFEAVFLGYDGFSAFLSPFVPLDRYISSLAYRIGFHLAFHFCIIL